MNYEEWIKLLKHPLNINWSEPLTEEEKTKVCSHLPRIAEFLEKEQKELRIMKKISDKFEREVGAKDTELSKERLRMRLRMKLADKKDAKAKEKEGRKHSCPKDCERCQRKREKKMLAAKKTLDVAKSEDPEFSEEKQLNPEGEKDLFLYREPDKDNNDDEKDGQNDEVGDDNDKKDDGNELGATACALPQYYSSPYKDSDLSENYQRYNLKTQEGMDQFENVAEGRGFNPYLPSHRFDYDFEKGEEVKSDEDDDDDAVRGLKMKLLEMSEEPKQSYSTSDFSKFLNYKYQF